MAVINNIHIISDMWFTIISTAVQSIVRVKKETRKPLVIIIQSVHVIYAYLNIHSSNRVKTNK